MFRGGPSRHRERMQNVQTIEKLYAWFGQGNIPAIIEVMSADVDWDYAQSDVTPWLTKRRGRDGVGAFFAAVGEHIEFKRFDLKEVFGTPDGSVVVALVDVEAVIKKTGRAIREEDEIHLWRFGRDGRVERFRHGVDTAAHLAAWR